MAFFHLPKSTYTITPIKLDYLNSNRKFYGDFMLSGSDTHFQFQDELSAVQDVCVAFDSVNFLTDVRDKFSEVTLLSSFAYDRTNTMSTLAVFDVDINVDCDNTPTAYSNYWITLPVENYTTGEECVGSTNVIPLKNNFSETHHTTCTPSYRTYTQFNFGNSGLDNLKPELLFRTKVDIQHYSTEQTEFTFKLPDNSPSLTGSDIPDFNCFGGLGGNCPTYTDNIKWYPDGSTEPIFSWLSGDDCAGVWADRIVGSDGEVVDIVPTQMELHSGIEYTYLRPNNETLDELRASIAESDETIFSFDSVSGDTIVDESSNKINGKYV